MIAGLPSPWEHGIALTPRQAERLLALAEVVQRVAAATGRQRLSEWLKEPNRRLDYRSPRELAAAGDFDRLLRLAASLETFTVS